MFIDDNLLDALADRWPNIDSDYPGQTFEAWLVTQLHYYNRFGYATTGREDSLWDLVNTAPPASDEDYYTKKADELRQIGGTFIQRVEDLRPMARIALMVGV